MLHFYPRPALAFGYCRCLGLCVCQSACQSLAYQQDNSGPVQARITKFGTKVQCNWVEVPIVLCSDRPWPSRSNLTLKPKFTPFWACPAITHNPFKLGSPNLDQICKLRWLRSVWFWRVIDLDLQGSNWLKMSRFPVSPLPEIHNHHLTTTILCIYVLLSWTASQSPLFHSLNPVHLQTNVDSQGYFSV